MSSADLQLIQAWRFDHKALISDGQAFEDFFTQIMRSRYPDFRQIKPTGRLGDRKNDGFVSSQGRYFQVYAPEQIDEADKRGAKKITGDFEGLLAGWKDGTPIRSFRFVVNDKLKNLGPDIEHALDQLRSKYPQIDIASFLVHRFHKRWT